MSRLSSLFGSGDTNDGSDSLRYSAPKEPKAGKAKETNTTTSSNLTVASSTPVGPVKSVAKIAASAAIRLFKFNSNTKAYDTQENGSPLGCILFGHETTFQLIVYNGQKVSLVVIPLTCIFQWTIKDLYVTFADPQGITWSLLFDSFDPLKNFTRCLVALIGHLNTFSEESQQVAAGFTHKIVSGSVSSSEETVTSNMSVGVYYTLWELGSEIGDHPADILSKTPFETKQNDVIKLKIASNITPSEEIFPGLNNSLIGAKKNDKVYATFNPRLAYSGCLDLSRRSNPTAWMLLEVEIVKMKKEKKKESDTPQIIQPTIAQIDMNNIVIEQENSKDIASRMAFLAQQGSGNAFATQSMAMMMGKNVQPVAQQHVQQPVQQSMAQQPVQLPVQQPIVQQPVQQPMDQASQFSQNLNTNQYQQQQPQQPQQQYQAQGAYGNTSSYIPQQQISQPIVQPNYQNFNSDYALTVVSGQESSRSYFMGNQSQQQPQVQTQSQSNYTPFSSYSQPNNNLPFQKQVIEAIDQLHLKVDHINSVVSNSNPSQSIRSSYKPINNTSSNTQNFKIRGEELIQGLQDFLLEYDKKIQDSNNDRSSDRDREMILKLESRLDGLQDRNEKLMMEKSSLLEKQSDMLVKSSEYSSKLFSLQQEFDTIRVERDRLLKQVQDNSQQSSHDEELKLNLERYQKDVAKMSQQNISLKAEHQEAISNLEEQNNEKQRIIESLHVELQNVKQELSQSIVNSNEKISSLEQLIANQSNKGNEQSGLNEDDVRSFMQDIYNVAVEVFPTSDNNLSSKDVMKRIRGILKKVTQDHVGKK